MNSVYKTIRSTVKANNPAIKYLYKNLTSSYSTVVKGPRRPSIISSGSGFVFGSTHGNSGKKLSQINSAPYGFFSGRNKNSKNNMPKKKEDCSPKCTPCHPTIQAKEPSCAEPDKPDPYNCVKRCPPKPEPCKKVKPCQPSIVAENIACSPCQKPDPCQQTSCQKPDPCQKKDPCPKPDPCQKKDPCPKPDPCKTKDPCQKASLCQKPDPCQKQDPCQKASLCEKPDPCQKTSCQKPDPCQKKSPCRKTDPCKPYPEKVGCGDKCKDAFNKPIKKCGKC